MTVLIRVNIRLYLKIQSCTLLTCGGRMSFSAETDVIVTLGKTDKKLKSLSNCAPASLLFFCPNTCTYVVDYVY